MNLTYKRATIEDIDILTETRIKVLRAANKLSDDIDMSKVEQQSYGYYKKALCDGTHIAYLIFDGNCFVGISPNRFVPSNKSRIISTFQRSLISIKVISTGQAGKLFSMKTPISSQ